MNVTAPAIFIFMMYIFINAAFAQNKPTQHAESATRSVGSSNVTCFQNGQAIINEDALRDLRFAEDMIYGYREDGTQVTIMAISGSTDAVCRLEQVKSNDIAVRR